MRRSPLVLLWRRKIVACLQLAMESRHLVEIFQLQGEIKTFNKFDQVKCSFVEHILWISRLTSNLNAKYRSRLTKLPYMRPISLPRSKRCAHVTQPSCTILLYVMVRYVIAPRYVTLVVLSATAMFTVQRNTIYWCLSVIEIKNQWQSHFKVK